MNSNFTVSTNKVFLKIPLLILILTILHIFRFITYEYTPDTALYILVWKLVIASITGFFFSWYFYLNKKWVLGIITHLLFILFAFQTNLSNLIDYYFSIDNSSSIRTSLQTILFLVSASWFAFGFFKTEKVKPNKKAFLNVFLLVIATYFVLASGLGKLSELFQQIISSDSSFFEYLVQLLVILTRVLKCFVLLIGFYYLLSKIINTNKESNILAPQYISKSFFSKGFAISYTLIFLVFFSVLENIVAFVLFSFFSRNSFDFYENIQLLSNFAYLIYAVCFLGQLMQYRSYSLKHFYGIFSAVALFPVLNTVSLFVLRHKRKVKSVSDFIKTALKQRNTHLFIYAVLMIAFILFINKDDLTNEDELAWIFAGIILHCICLFIVSLNKKNVYIAPAIITLLWIIKNYSSFSFIETITENVFDVSILSQGIFIITIYYLTYYLLFYIYHKAFYVNTDEEQIKAELDTHFSNTNESEVL
ncbi:hypothetical protein V6246_12580 [Algibacter sp. TI.3.09]|uniref:hypothetical protein n=1 Tax=Algibacter sp. TI.3.09 TaxID=3121298 RepID=UPI00311FD35E